jgi:tetratricopeptide (TPR) repeat protein
MTSPDLDVHPLEAARRLAEDGDLQAAAGIFAELAADPDHPDRAQAAVGLALVLEERGDIEAARTAARTALATGHPEFAAQAACHLAQGFEGEGRLDQARAAWQAVIGLGNPAYLPSAHLALARLAVQAGDGGAAEAALREAVATGDQQVAAVAAQRLAEHLLEKGEPGAAATVLIDALGVPDIADQARLRVLLGIAHLEMACAEFAGAVESEVDPPATALAVELLARTLPLRGRHDEADQVWRYGLDHVDEEVAQEVRLRFDRDLPLGS